MKTILSITLAAVTAAPALAGFDFAQVSSTIYTTPEQQSANFDDGFGTITADLATGAFGNVSSTMTTADASILMTSAMSTQGGVAGNATAAAVYMFTSPTTVTVTWDWTDLSQAGLWSVTQYGGTLLQRLSFFDGGFSSVGGNYGRPQAAPPPSSWRPACTSSAAPTPRPRCPPRPPWSSTGA